MKNEKKFNYKKPIIAALIIVICYLISLFVPVISVYTKYPLYFVKCGGQPIFGYTLKNQHKYYVPGDPLYRIDITGDKYFCSEKEARSAGYERNIFEVN